MDRYYEKYLKYKSKYLQLKGGASAKDVKEKLYDRQGEEHKCAYGYYNVTHFEKDLLERKCNQLKNEVTSEARLFELPNCMTSLYKEYIKFNEDKPNKLTKLIFNDLFDSLDSKLVLPTTKTELISYIDKKGVPKSSFDNNRYIKNLLNRITPNTNGSIIIEKICQRIDESLSLYFTDNQITNIEDKINPGNIIPKKDYNSYLLNLDKYVNIFMNKEEDIIKNKDLICLEGNRIFADKDCKVASGGITSCMFMILFFSDNTFLASHFNTLVTNNILNDFDPNLNSNYYYTYDNCFQVIRRDFPGKIKLINKIFIGGVLTSYNMDNNESKSFIDNSYKSRGINITLELIKERLEIPNTQEIKFIKDKNDGNYIVYKDSVYFIKK
jgi:hypothetical protein